MFKQYRTFYSVLLLLALTTTIVIVMYSYTINISLSTVKQDIQTNNLNRIRFVVNNLDHSVRQLDMLGMALEADKKLGLLPSIDLMDSYDQVKLILDLTDKMNLQSFSEGWNNQIAIYSPVLDQWIGSSPTPLSVPNKADEDKWILDVARETFISYRFHTGYTIQVSFPRDNIRQMLDQAKIEHNDPFFYKADASIIANSDSDPKRIEGIIANLRLVKPEGTAIVKLDGTPYMVNYLLADSLGWYLIDYLPSNEALQPIVRTQNYFYAACIALFLAGVLIAVFLYRKVQVPIVTLLKGVRLLKHGDFSYRIKKVSRNEFDILYENFNDMTAQIEDLIEKVYKEKIASREAMVKQLQAQINPHFLYNCLFFINNMTRLGNDEAVTAMTKNLAEYFRYSTRLDEPITTLEKELGVVRNYLEIQCLRMDRLSYEIDVPEPMLRLRVPKLLLQPLVENSVIHGIENKRSSGWVKVSGKLKNGSYEIRVEDDGKGMSEEEIRHLLGRLQLPPDDSMGRALWNVSQRMGVHFDPPSGMEIEPRPEGGLAVVLHWKASVVKED
ncbi:sensor histidine kinase [Cohnella thailandensis]|uniref:Sensor histidine kinase n=1 Tax=Cohnella thailandensis TaxID=557557 RepID=A0A841SUE5_9BACL|nr:sensor histidine kinase [Cohnella thailandensis]MBB6634629.1 sensor histidine kinase [Cohnella thailandensis]MBP1972815.1 two-component system sensor histidine kinase YesM [Cohnella thailandensis]